MTTQTVHRTDTSLKTDVVNELQWAAEVNGTHIGVGVTDGAVTLSGEVTSYPEKRRAERAAQRVRGVTSIADEISVKTPWTKVNDTDIAREAGEALDRSVQIPSGSVKAAVQDHMITSLESSCGTTSERPRRTPSTPSRASPTCSTSSR